MKQLFTFLLIFIITKSFCQVGGVGISPTGSTPDPSAMLDISATNKGLLMPRISQAQRDSIINPAKGLFIYNTDCDVVNFNAGTPASPNWATLNSSNAITAGVVISANPVGAICAGTSVTFTATPNQTNLSPSFQWQVNGANVGANSSTYTTSTLNNADVVTCIMSTSANCVVGSPATSNPVTMLVSSIPSITQTYPDSFCSGSPATLSATSSTGGINWYSAPTGGSSLATSGTFTVSGLTATTTYYVDVTANGCTSASRTAVTATYYPTTPAQPGSITGSTTVSINGTATYSIAPVPYTGKYIWTAPLGTITSGQGTDSINVTWDTIGFGSVSVVTNNPCGTSAEQIVLPITVSGTGSQTFNYTGSIQTFTVPTGITSISIDALGAQGGDHFGISTGGNGADILGTFPVTPGELLSVIVGQQGQDGCGNQANCGAGGGGGSFVYSAGPNLLIAAGGGGGGSLQNDGAPYINGDVGQSGTCGSASKSCYAGGCNGANGNGSCAGNGWNTIMSDPAGIGTWGGYGGGGNPQDHGGGGGGGYSGGGGNASGGCGLTYGDGGGGGGSYNAGTGQTNLAGVQSGNGVVYIVW